MPPALFLLMRLRYRATGRRIFRGVKTTRGAIFLALGLMIFISWIGGAAIGLFFMRRSADLEKSAIAAPMALLLFAVVTLLFSSSNTAIHFDRAEVDLLFAAPFTRRQLLAYKLAGGVIAAALVSIFFSTFLVRFASFWLAAYLGCFLAAMFNQFFSTTIFMARTRSAKRRFTILRQALLLAMAALLVAGIFAALGEGPADLWTIARRFEAGICGTILLAPFQAFAHVFTSTRIVPDMIGWSIASMAILVVMGFIVIRLDADFLEASVVASQRVYERVQRFRRTGSIASAPTGTRARLPMPPWCHGAGPIAWRQLVTALRSSRTLLMVLLMTSLAMGPVLLFGRVTQHTSSLLVPVIIWMTIWLVRTTSFDFRGDLDHMDWLRSTPISALWITIGEIAAPIIVISIFHVLLIGSVSAFLKEERQVLWAAGAFIVPWNVLTISIENAVFLTFPARQRAAGPGDLQGVGRDMVVVMLKLALLLAGGGTAAGLGALAWLLAGHSIIAGGVTAWLALAAVAALALMLVVGAFRKFDPSLQMPA